MKFWEVEVRNQERLNRFLAYYEFTTYNSVNKEISIDFDKYGKQMKSVS